MSDAVLVEIFCHVMFLENHRGHVRSFFLAGDFFSLLTVPSVPSRKMSAKSPYFLGGDFRGACSRQWRTAPRKRYSPNGLYDAAGAHAMRSPVNTIYWEIFGPRCHERAARWQSNVKLAPLRLVRQCTVRVGSIALFVFDGPGGGMIFAVELHGPTTTASACGIAREQPPRAPPAAPFRREAPSRGLALAAGEVDGGAPRPRRGGRGGRGRDASPRAPLPLRRARNPGRGAPRLVTAATKPTTESDPSPLT